MSVSDEIRRRTGFAHFVEIKQRRGSRGLVTVWTSYHYDPRLGVCLGVAATPPGAFAPAQPPRETVEQVVSTKLENALRLVEARGRIIPGPHAERGCALRVDQIRVEKRDDEIVTSATLRVLERGQEAYRESLQKNGEEIAEAGEELAADLIGFLRNNYDKITTVGATSEPR